MREILFRGKREDDGKWVEGFYTEENVSFPSGMSVIENNKNDYPVDKETVGQFIGLLDKNGTKIFEGDILAFRLEDSENETIDGVVKYGQMNCGCCDGVYGWYIEGGDIRALDMKYGFDDDERLYVVGNIYDNPELWRGR